MNDFTPIPGGVPTEYDSWPAPTPGVWYQEASDFSDEPELFLYAPGFPRSNGWYSSRRRWLSDDVPVEPVEVFNPHPPTETVYMVIAGGASSKPIFGEWETEEEARQDRDLEYGGKLFERQVTKWREI